MTPDRLEQLLRDTEQRLTTQITEVKGDIAEIRKDAKDAAVLAAEAAKFGDTAQAIAKVLAFLLGIIVMCATIYGVFHP